MQGLWRLKLGRKLECWPTGKSEESVALSHCLKETMRVSKVINETGMTMRQVAEATDAFFKAWREQ